MEEIMNTSTVKTLITIAIMSIISITCSVISIFMAISIAKFILLGVGIVMIPVMLMYFNKMLNGDALLKK